MPLGEQLGRGGTSDVYAWGPGLAIKVFTPGFEDLAQIERERATVVHDAGVPSPAAHDLVAIGYRELRDGPSAVHAHQRRQRAADTYLERYATLRPGSLDDLILWTTAIGTLLLEREPETAFADELRSRWIRP